MTITLNVGATSVDLHQDLYWDDEFSWAPVEQSVTRTITGALIVQSALRIGGRPITLRPFEEGCAWMQRSVLEQLRTWAAVAGQQMTLTLRGTARTVIFRHQDTAIESSPVSHLNDVAAGDFYSATLRFSEIA
jgi:hypothetical protein